MVRGILTETTLTIVEVRAAFRGGGALFPLDFWKVKIEYFRFTPPSQTNFLYAALQVFLILHWVADAGLVTLPAAIVYHEYTRLLIEYNVTAWCIHKPQQLAVQLVCTTVASYSACVPDALLSLDQFVASYCLFCYCRAFGFSSAITVVLSCVIRSSSMSTWEIISLSLLTIQNRKSRHQQADPPAIFASYV